MKGIEVEIENEEKEKGYDEYDCRHFAETLMKAEEIKSDPKKMAAAEKHVKKMKKQISSIADLRKLANESSDEDS